MAWLRIDDRFRTHPKIQRAQLAGWLHFCGICYCREHLTDGIIPREAVISLAPGLSVPYKHAAKLVAIGLWHEDPDGFRVHDFLDWNPSRQDVMSLRDKERDKKRTQRGHDGDSHAGARIGAGDAGLGSLSGSPVELGDLELSEKSARETIADPVWTTPTARQQETPALLNGSQQRLHGVHAWCSGPFGRDGLCVPLGLHAQLTGRLSGPDADRRLRAWYRAVVAGLGDQPVGDRLFDFWENHFAAWVGTVTSRPASAGKEGRIVGAAQRTVEAIRRGDL